LSSALQMNHNYIGTEHLLLGLVQGDGVAADVLRDSGLTQDVLARDVTNRLARYVEGSRAVKVPGKRAAGKASASTKRGATKVGVTRKSGATTKARATNKSSRG
jgi:ATP-dependent Clp protease ATP-binding subunit ClpC